MGYAEQGASTLLTPTTRLSSDLTRRRHAPPTPTATMSSGDRFTTPVTSSRFVSSIPRSNAVKRDSLAAELEHGE